MMCKIAWGFECLAGFPKAWNNGVYFQLRKTRQTFKDIAKAHQRVQNSGTDVFTQYAR